MPCVFEDQWLFEEEGGDCYVFFICIISSIMVSRIMFLKAIIMCDYMIILNCSKTFNPLHYYTLAECGSILRLSFTLALT